MQIVPETQQSTIICSEHGCVSEYYNNQCAKCVASINESRKLSTAK